MGSGGGTWACAFRYVSAWKVQQNCWHPQLAQMLEPPWSDSEVVFMGWEVVGGVPKWPWFKAFQNRWYHLGIGAPPILVHFSGDWDVHSGYGVLTHGQISP